MTRVKYATPSMVEHAAQECSARASWWATGNVMGVDPVHPGRLAWAAWRGVCPEGMGLPGNDWAEAEARLREGRLPDGWAWRCPARVADRCDGSCVRFDAVIATAWAPGKGPSL